MKRHSLRTDRVTRSDVERLEGRTLLANIAVANAYLTDVNFNRLETPPAVGEEYGIRVDFTTTDVPETTRFRVLNGVDGVNITSDPVAAGGTWHGRFGYFAKPEGAEIRVKLDSTALVAETDETDNEVTFSFTPVEPDPPFKMVNPVAGEYGEDWAVTVYADVDPRPGNESDYRDRGYVYDGSKVAWFSVGD